MWRGVIDGFRAENRGRDQRRAEPERQRNRQQLPDPVQPQRLGHELGIVVALAPPPRPDQRGNCAESDDSRSPNSNTSAVTGARTDTASTGVDGESGARPAIAITVTAAVSPSAATAARADRLDLWVWGMLGFGIPPVTRASNTRTPRQPL